MMLIIKHGLKASSCALSILGKASVRPFAAETQNSATSQNEALIRNCLQTGLGFTHEAVSLFASSNPNLFNNPPADAKIPGIWSTMQRYGLSNTEKFRALCLKEPRIASLEPSHVDLLLKTFEEYSILENPEQAFDMLLMNPKIMLKKAEKTKRLLYVMYRLIQCEKPYIGYIVLQIPTVLLTSVIITAKNKDNYRLRTQPKF